MLLRCVTMFVLVMEGQAARALRTVVNTTAGVKFNTSTVSADLCSEQELIAIYNQMNGCKCVSDPRWEACNAFVSGVSQSCQLYWYCQYSVMKHDCKFTVRDDKGGCGMEPPWNGVPSYTQCYAWLDQCGK